MSETGPDPQPQDESNAHHSRWVKAKVVGEELEPPPGAPQPGEQTVEEPAPIPVPGQPAVTDEELTGARWFSIAFLLVVIPLGLVLLALIVWAFVRSIEM
jgi:hypothetical protein